VYPAKVAIIGQSRAKSNCRAGTTQTSDRRAMFQQGAEPEIRGEFWGVFVPVWLRLLRKACRGLRIIKELFRATGYTSRQTEEILSMKDPLHHDPVDMIGEAYERMLERALEDLRAVREKTGPAFHDLIDKARDTAVELGELSRDEADRLSAYLKRDLSDAAGYLVETGDELKDWLGFETRLIESKAFELFMRAADKTTVELLALKEKVQAGPDYHTGEVTGPGTLVCDKCGARLQFHKPGKIPPCASCHASSFHRARR
jgi:hypothetical protein